MWRTQFFFFITLAFGPGPAWAAPVTVYWNDFDAAATIASGVTATMSGAGTVVSSESLPAPFSGNLLLNSTAPPVATVFTLMNLPTHTSVDIEFDFVFIDSWDSLIAPPNGADFFNVSIDGATALQITCNNANGTDCYSGTQIGTTMDYFNQSFPEVAFDLSSEPSLSLLHSASTLTVQLFASGDGWQGGFDEAWAVDNFSITVDMAAVPTPAALPLFTTGLGIIGFFGWRKRKCQRAA
jgi:hypothetical protein